MIPYFGEAAVDPVETRHLARNADNPLLHALEGAVPAEQKPAFTVYDDIRCKTSAARFAVIKLYP